jgi:hypothetical protein
VTKLQDARFRKTNFTSHDETVFDADMLKLLMAIDEGKPVLQIAKEINMEPAVFRESFLKLFKAKLIEEVKQKIVYTDEAFLTRLKETLVNLTGPLGGILMEEIAEKMNFEVSRIPKSSIADFVYQVAKEIPGDKEQAEFKRVMIQEIKNME